jgi:tetratricopeptide (TPR) repeat protein
MLEILILYDILLECIMSMQYKKCPTCGSLNPAENEKCYICGRPLPPNTIYSPTPINAPMPKPTTPIQGQAYINEFEISPFIYKNKFYYIVLISVVLPMIGLIPFFFNLWYLGILLAIVAALSGYEAIKYILKKGSLFFNNGMNLMLKGDFTNAIIAFNLSLDYGYNPYASIFNQAICFKNLNNLNGAMERATLLDELIPNYYMNILLKGIINQETNSRTALANYQDSIKANPNNGIAWNNMGVILEKMGRKSEAYACYDKSTKSDPTLKEAWINKAEMAYSLGNKREGDMAYEYSIKL